MSRSSRASRVLLALLAAAATGLGGMYSLKVMPGARAAGMGSAGVTGAGPQGISWNPAAGASVDGFAVQAGYGKWLLDAHQEALSVVRGTGLVNVGLAVTAFNAGRFEYRTEVPTEEPLGYFNPAEYVFMLNLSRRFGIVDVGLSGRYYYAKTMEDEASGPGADLGVRVRPVDGLELGLSLTDFGKNLAFIRESFRLPTRARLGAAWTQCLGPEFAAELVAQGSYFVYTGDVSVGGGVELGWNRTLFLRGGYEWLGARGRPTGGLGVGLGEFRFDYALALLNDGLGTSHRLTIGFGR
jgi:hypothetical protein